jgi:phage shock protein A
LKAKRREMEEELGNFKNAQNTPTGQTGTSAKGSKVDDKMEKATAAFDRVVNRASGLPGMSGPEDRKSAEQLAELDDLARKNAIQERLNTLKGSA